MATGVKRLFGHTYQVAGPCARGQAMPEIPSSHPSRST